MSTVRVPLAGIEALTGGSGNVRIALAGLEVLVGPPLPYDASAETFPTPVRDRGTETMGELLALTPPGWALPQDPASVWANFLAPVAAEWLLVSESAESMLDEIDPRTATNCLPDYVRVLGPDPYGRDAATLDLTTTELGQLTWARWTDGGNMAPSDYVDLAAQSGVTITIQEYWQSQSGDLQCGWSLCCDRYTECGAAECGQCLAWSPTQFVWLVTIPTADTAVAAALLGEAPSHTLPVFDFT